jgi:hypothetical protein
MSKTQCAAEKLDGELILDKLDSQIGFKFNQPPIRLPGERMIMQINWDLAIIKMSASG